MLKDYKKWLVTIRGDEKLVVYDFLNSRYFYRPLTLKEESNIKPTKEKLFK